MRAARARLFKTHDDVRFLPLSEHLMVYYIWIRLLDIRVLLSKYEYHWMNLYVGFFCVGGLAGTHDVVSTSRPSKLGRLLLTRQYGYCIYI